MDDMFAGILGSGVPTSSAGMPLATGMSLGGGIPPKSAVHDPFATFGNATSSLSTPAANINTNNKQFRIDF